VRIRPSPPQERGTGKTRGIYVVAFGDPARTCALRMMKSAKKHMPDIPIALCAAKRIGPEDVLIVQPDSDVGGRRAKLRAYELAPAEWQSVLYLDADTEIVAPVYQFFQWCEDGWEFVICTDVGETLHSFSARTTWWSCSSFGNQSGRCTHCSSTAGYGRFADARRCNRSWSVGGVNGKCTRNATRAPLIRALYANPIKIFVLGNEWNKFPKYTPNVETAGVMHYPGTRADGKGNYRGGLMGRMRGPSSTSMSKRMADTFSWNGLQLKYFDHPYNHTAAQHAACGDPDRAVVRGAMPGLILEVGNVLPIMGTCPGRPWTSRAGGDQRRRHEVEA